MDEVDQIILSSLKESGYITNDTLTNIRAYPFDEVVKMIIHCLKIIQPESNFPHTLPAAMSIRYNICAQFAQICKDLGYKGEVGYHTFMYKNYDDVRRVLIFLAEHLPKKITFQESKEVESAKNVTVKQKTIEKLKQIFDSRNKYDHCGICKTPFISMFLETGTLLPEQKIDCKPVEWRNFVVEQLPFIDEQLPDYRCFLPSLISLNSEGIIHSKKLKSSKFTLNLSDNNYLETSSKFYRCNVQVDNSSYSSIEDEAFELAQNINDLDITEMHKKVKQNDCIPHENLELSTQSEDHTIIIKLEEEIKEIKSHLNMLSIKLTEITDNNNISREILKEKHLANTALEKALQLLPNSENNIPQLEAVNEKYRTKIDNIRSQWERHKTLLEDKLSELRKLKEFKNIQKNTLLQQIAKLRKDLLDVVEQIEKRKVVEEQLTEYTKSTKGVQRNDYIHRILEIIKSLKKQETQIKNILNDLKRIQKEINTISGKVERSFNLTEQLITANSHSDDFSYETYNLLLRIHQDVSEMLTIVGETGNYLREIKDLEDQMLDNSNHVADALQQITTDLERLKEEQNKIQNEIRQFDDRFEIEPVNNVENIYFHNNTSFSVVDQQ
ncbi:hypothetical protein PGB90_008805 [Kerria lacca]